jgi:saccharopine dehydrogenase-like NADP-dependent oxidoreductase
MGDRVLVIGATGAFGGRLVQGLISTTDLDLIIAGRDRGRSTALAEAINKDGRKSRATALQLDVATVTPDQLRNSGAFIVVDAAGPYQGSGYRLARAAIAAGLHYIDLADARDFVAHFHQLDATAKNAGVIALTGASSTPALSTAVLDKLTSGWRSVETVDVAISPGNRAAPRGLSVIRSILSYAGRGVQVFVEGEWVTRMGWGMLISKRMPGMGRRWLSLCETPDLDVIPERYHVRRTAIFRGGLELTGLHLGLFVMACLVRVRIINSLLPWARMFRVVAAATANFGTDRGGMTVEASGLDAAGKPIRSHWTLVAEHGDGPNVPILPALAAIRAIAAKKLNHSGASICAGILDLATIEREFQPYRIRTHINIETQAETTALSPFQRILGASFDQLPAPVRALHSLTHSLNTAGLAEIRTAPGPLPWLICQIAGLPRDGSDVPVTVFFRPEGNGHEFWRRRFVDRRYASTLSTEERDGKMLLIEQLGPFQLSFHLEPTSKGLVWLLVTWKFMGVPLPRWTLLKVKCLESGDGDRFVFDIDFAFPLIGPVIHYRGWLVQQHHLSDRGIMNPRNQSQSHSNLGDG